MSPTTIEFPKISVTLYQFFIRLLFLTIRIAAPLHSKARRWVNGRKKWRKKVEEMGAGNRQSIWIHAASLGEFEMARPLIGRLRKYQPEKKVFVSFFSPSGYDHATMEDGVEKFYLPLDTRSNALFCIDHLRPEAIIFVKYDLWFNLISSAQKSGVALYLFNYHPSRSALRKPLFGKLLRRSLGKFDQIYTLNENGYNLLCGLKGLNLSIGSDTRFKNVLDRKQNDPTDEKIAQFAGQFKKVVVCGSIWKEDWKIIEPAIDQLPDLGWIVAPHEVSGQKVKETFGGWKKGYISYTRDELRGDSPGKNVLVLDCIGKLAPAYKHGFAAYVGGGFGTGLHNILEPAAYGLPVSFGPVHDRFPEAKQFKDNQIGCEVNSSHQFSDFLIDVDRGETYKNGKEIIDQMKVWSDRSDQMLGDMVETLSKKKGLLK